MTRFNLRRQTNFQVRADGIEVVEDFDKAFLHIQRWNRQLLWLGDKVKTLNYTPKSDEMVLTVHRWFANKSCPGNWMYARMGDLASKVTAQLGGAAKSAETYRTYTVVHGDTLWTIAQKYLGNGSRYKEIIRLNGLKSNVLSSGMKLKLPNK